ncbi:hypothetical protein B0H13DRAFT_2374598 [Mycena leptocephala]|nr:hypothetical protein B0H13DRAFT_2374598 [Mycena leptocephala]
MTLPAAISSPLHGVSHDPHPRIAPHPVPPCASSAPSRTCPPSHNNLDISPPTSTRKNTIPAAVPSHFHVTSHTSHPHIAPRSVRSSASSAPSRTRPPSYSNIDTSPSTITPRKKRSRRCFVCGGTGRHRLHPRFCPRTLELIANKLAMFNFEFRLVSFNGSPLPMTRHPGGVAAHLLSPRGSSSRPARISPRSPSKSSCSPDLNPPHVPHVLRIGTPRPIPAAIPIANLNRPHTSHSPVETPLRISSPDRRTLKSNSPHVAAAAPIRPRIIEPSVDSNPPHATHATTIPRRVVDPTVDLDSLHASRPSLVHPRTSPRSDHSVASSILHFPPVERLPSPPIYLPVRVPLPELTPTAVPTPENQSPLITLTLFDLLFVSPPIRNELRKLIDAIDRSNVGYDIPSSPALRKVFHRILDQITDSLLSPR